MIVTEEFVRRCIASGDMLPFYNCRPWKRLRKEILADDRNECQECKARGRYSRATHVHHVNHVRYRPELAMSRTYLDDDGTARRNLVSVCKRFHDTVCHPEKEEQWHGQKKPPLTEEWW